MSLFASSVSLPDELSNREGIKNKNVYDEDDADADAKEPEDPRLKRLTAKDCMDKFYKCRKNQRMNSIDTPGDCLTGPNGFTSCH